MKRIQDAYIIRDITPFNSKTYNQENRQFTFSPTCQFRKLVLCMPEEIDEVCGETLSTNSNVYITRLDTNNITSIYTLYSTSILTGLTLISIESNLIYSLECYEINLEQVNFKLVNQYYKTLDRRIFGYSYYGLFKLEGVSNDQPYSIHSTNFTFDIPECSLYYQYSNYYLLHYSYSNNIVNVTSPIKLQLSNLQKTISYYLDPIIKESVIDISMFSYPNILDGLVLSGYNQGPLFSFTTNTTAYDSLYLLQVYQVALNSTLLIKEYYPIYGDQLSTTFLLPFTSYGNQVNYQFSALNKKSLDNEVTLNSIYIPQYYFSNPQIKPTILAYGVMSFTSPFIRIIFTHSTIKYSLTKFNIKLSNYPSISKAFPYGFGSGTVDSYIYSICVPVLNYDNEIVLIGGLVSITSEVDNSGYSNSYTNVISGNSNGPVIKNVVIIHLVSDIYLYRITADIPNSFSHISIYLNEKEYGPETLISGTYSLGIFEFVAQAKYDAITLYDTLGNFQTIQDSSLLSVDPITIYKSPLFKNFDYYSIQDVSFLYNSLDVTSYRQFNIIYFNYSSDVPRDRVFILSPLDDLFQDLTSPKSSIFNNIFYSTYNQSLQLFQIEFYVESNTPSGYYQFDLLYGLNYINSNSLSSKLKIKSNNMDLRGPIIKQMNTSIPTITTNGPSGIIIIKILIQDMINGFDNGYITIRGEIDQSIYNFTFTSNDVLDNGNQYLGTYQFEINANYPCVSQNLIITEVKLFDKLNRASFFSIYSINSQLSSVMNPFVEFINQVSFNKFYLNCLDQITDTSPPTLDSFSISESLIDVSKTDRQVTFSFSASDLESGIKIDQHPIVYLTTVYNKIIECKSNITSITPNTDTSPYGNTISYSCTIQLPLGFGYLNGIYVSVYGFINNNGYFFGLSSSDLYSQSSPYFIKTHIYSNVEPNIESYFRISEYGTDLWLFGNNLISTSMAYISFDNSTIEIKPTKLYSSAILLNITVPTDKSFNTYVILSNGFKSNTITIIPTIFNYYNQSSSSSSESSSSSSSSSDMLPTLSPLPTNSPQSCPGNPICGGPSNGKCIENQGCVCYSPWIGLDCLSQIIIIDQPTTNDTSPSTNITLPVNNNNSSTTVTYKSLITLVSIRELNVLGSVVYNKPFDKWQVRELDSTTFIYNTTLSINKNNQISTTEFTVTLKWFTNETTINFANEQLLMNPSTMKYTIEINNYPFDNNLNQLQLIMSASLQSNSSDNICSLREYGETTSGDNFNYLKIQVDNHSLFGRFIRRGIIDSTITTITNVLLDKDMNSITTTKELQSYIAIQIPNYKISVIVDPDFSIIIDSYSASSKSNSICSSKSKLTNGKIAGIVIGCAAFLTVIIIAVSYHIIKKKNKQKFMENVNQKMKQMN